MRLEFLRIFKAWKGRRKDGTSFTTIQQGKKTVNWKTARDFTSLDEAIQETKTVRSRKDHIEFIADTRYPPYKE